MKFASAGTFENSLATLIKCPRKCDTMPAVDGTSKVQFRLSFGRRQISNRLEILWRYKVPAIVSKFLGTMGAFERASFQMRA